MAEAPQIALRDGKGVPEKDFTTNLAFTTNEEAVSISGVFSADTASIQVSVNGGDFVADPNLVSFVGQTFTIPNLSVYPTGLPLEFGVNTVLIRVVDIVGSVSASSTVIVTRVLDTDTGGTQIPTGVRVQRYRDQVKIQALKPQPLRNLFLGDDDQQVLVTTETSTFLGFNFYASTEPAGASGYYRVNDKPVLATTDFEQDNITAYDDLAVWEVSDARTLRVRVSEEDGFGNELKVRLDVFHDNATISGKLQFSGILQNYEMNEFVSFMHNRQGGTGIINTDQFLSVPSTEPLYYVVTGVYYDPATSTETETPFSQEVLGAPLTIDTAIRDLPSRTQTQIVIDYMSAVLRVNSEISLVPGSVTRDVDIDPFASEAERIWFLLDFVHRSQSFLTLLAIDNVSSNGVSDPVAGSAYKQALKAALGLRSDSAVQSLIDQQFDKLAGNVNKSRLFGRQAIGTLTLYTPTRPAKDIQIPAGTFALSSADPTTGVRAQRYRIGGSFVMAASNADAYYNFDERRYEIRVAIVAESAGAAGNVPAKTIKSVIGVLGLQAINESAVVFGSDQESNADLAARAMRGFASVDTGTETGYGATAAAKIGVIRNKVIKSGDSLMMRDYDEVRRKHIGGKVDVWIQGVQERQVQERFAFTFDIALKIQCEVLEPASSLKFRVLDSRVTPTSPIVEILNGVRNVTLGVDYDINGVTILDYNVFQLDTSVTQPETTLDDLIVVDYRLRVQNKFFMSMQPVRRVVSVVGETSGALVPGVHYKFYKTDDPLLEGESTIAKNYVAITPSGGVPRGQAIGVNDELRVMIGFEQEPLNSIGINTATIRVFNEQRTMEYNPPGTLGAAPDFDIIAGTPTTPAKIVRTDGSRIANGQEVSIDYFHDENFTVTYVINDLLQQLQKILDTKRHVTADVLAKQAVQNQVDIETTVQLARGGTKEKTDALLRNEVSLDLNRKLIGQGVAQSNIDAAINDTEGVQFNVLPMTRMAYADGSMKLREGVLSTSERVSTLDRGGNIAYILTNPLEFPTTDGGGLETEHKGVFQDDIAMSMSSTLASVCNALHQAFIIGADGAIIAGYSDDETLELDGFLVNEYAEERIRRTSNHIVVSLLGSGVPVDSPVNHSYAASYVIRGDVGAHDINVSSVELIELGVLTVTYRSGDRE